jgi:hypothetical protein
MSDHRPLVQSSLRAALEDAIGEWVDTHCEGNADPREISATLLHLAGAILKDQKLPYRESNP